MTARRALPLIALAATLAGGGCGYGTPAQLTSVQEQARVAFLKAHRSFTDRELAQLCPGLYPRDLLTNTKKYPEAKLDKGRTASKVTAADRTQAAAAGCAVRP